MKTTSRYFSATMYIVLAIMLLVLVSGCTSSSAPKTNTDIPASPTQTPYLTETIPGTIASTVQTPATTPVSGAASGITTTSLSHGVTISYPSDWQKEEVSELALRDYGRTTLNIANFFSPDISAERGTKDTHNPDTSAYTTLSIDVDPNPVTDFEQYFNLVAIALQQKYGHIEITKHNYQLKISPTETFPGYKSYQMDFDAANMRGSYIFTDVDKTIYIFAFKNPTPYSAEVQDMYKSIKIVPVTDNSKHR